VSLAGDNDNRKPLLIAIGGEAAEVVSGIDLGKDNDVIIIDTDSRTAKRYPEMNTMVIGSKVVRGEGTGGNMNLARACFKIDMENIAPKILGRPLVMILSSTEGATGIAGSVEISSLLVKVGMPAFSFLLHDISIKESGIDPLHIASMLLDGPLRPGCILIRDSVEGATAQDPFGLSATIPFFLSSVKRAPGFLLSPTCWSVLRDDGGPFEIGPIEMDSNIQRMNIKVPAVVSLKVPEDWSTESVRAVLDGAFGQNEGLHLGLTMESGIDHIRGAYIAKSVQKIPAPQGPPPDPEMLKELLGGPMDIDIIPSRNIQ
jgi:hypothetical protein